MLTTNIFKLIKFEDFKQRKYMSFLILLAGTLLVNLWIFEEAKDKYRLWETIIMRGSIINAFIIPIVIAIYAARQMDPEHKGDTWKLLYTFVSPCSLFFAKIIRGTVQIFLSFLLQTVLIIMTGIYLDYPKEIPFIYFAWLFLCNFLVTEILFLLQSLLAFFLVNPAASICTGLAGGFLGFFLIFFPNVTLVRRLIPWGLFLNTSAVLMDWNEVTKIASFYFVDFPFNDLIVCFVWIATLLILCSALSVHGNTDERILKFKKRGKEKNHTIHLPAELLKMRQLPIWLTLILLPAISAFMGTLNYLGNKDILSGEWLSLWSQQTIFINYLFLPVIIGIFASGIWHVEHTGANWNQLLVNASASKIVMEKYAVMIFYDTLAIVWITVLFIFSGKFLCGFTERLPVMLADWVICGFFGAVCLSGFQLLVSLIIRNYVVPVGMSFLGSAAGLFMIAQFKKPYILPHSLLAIGMRSNNPDYKINYGAFFTSCIIQFFLWAGLCVYYVNHTDVRSSEN